MPGKIPAAACKARTFSKQVAPLLRLRVVRTSSTLLRFCAALCAVRPTDCYYYQFSCATLSFYNRRDSQQLTLVQTTQTNIAKYAIRRFVLKPDIAISAQFPGDVVRDAGVFRVRHSNSHYRQAEIYLYAGLCLPDCTRLGYNVTYTIVERISHQDHLRNTGKAECHFGRGTGPGGSRS